MLYSFVIAGAMLAAYGLNVVVVRYAVRLKEEAVFGTRRKLMRRLLFKDPVFFHHFNAGDILTRFTNDLYIIGEYFYEHLVFSIIYLIMAFVFIVWLFALNILMAICVYLFFLIHLGVSVATYRSIVRRTRIAQDKNSEQNEFILDTLCGETEIRVYQQKSAFLERFDKKGQDYCAAQTRALYLREGVWTALARSLIREPQVLVLDEFTSGLDQATEEQIFNDLLALMTNRTIVCITHSPNVAAKMDRTIRLDNVVNLSKNNGRYFST